MERWYEVPKGERGRKPSDGRLSDFRCQTGSVQRNVPPTYDGQHGAERFLDSARNDNRAAERPGFRRFRGFCPLPAGGFKGCGIAASGHACGDEYIVSVTGLIFVSEVRHDEVPKPLPADWYLWALRSLTTCTEILHCVQNDGAGRKVSPQAAEDRGVIGAASRLGFRRFRGF